MQKSILIPEGFPIFNLFFLCWVGFPPKILGQCNPWTKSLEPLDLGLVQVGLHWCNPWTSYLLDQTYTGTLGN